MIEYFVCDDNTTPRRFDTFEDALDYVDREGARGMSSDDGRPVAVPLTQGQAERIIHDTLWQHDDSSAVDFMSAEALGEALRAVPPEVLAAAMGGKLTIIEIAHQVYPATLECIVVPPREVSRGDR